MRCSLVFMLTSETGKTLGRKENSKYNRNLQVLVMLIDDNKINMNVFPSILYRRSSTSVVYASREERTENNRREELSRLNSFTLCGQWRNDVTMKEYGSLMVS